MPPPRRYSHPEISDHIVKINQALDENIPVYFITFGGLELEHFHIPELLAVSNLQQHKINLFEPYSAPICYFTCSSLNQTTLTILCNALSQCQYFGQIASISHSIEEQPHKFTGQLINNFYSAHNLSTFSMQANIIGDVFQHQTKLDHLSRIQSLSLFSPPKANLNNPETHLQLMYDLQSEPTRFIFGFNLNSTQTPIRKKLQQLDLPKRCYLGTTSMDNELATIMLNLAQIKPGDFVMDPFCGTCSILMSASQMGCYCVGSDLDIKVLRGKETTYVDGFTQYGMNYADLSWSDIHKPWTKDGTIDAVVCDPPYNIRAGAKITEKDSKENNFGVGCKQQGAKGLYLQLIQMASKALKIGGRLVFWLPVPYTEFDETDIMWCDGMRVECYPMQVLSSKYGRRLVCYVKEAEGENCGYHKEHVVFDNIREVVGMQ
ncbi:Putative_RNA methylase [Hexamita inflata]|uniref:RNA methylase n=1 Tax=Hexamita inflata TaxID=28002 RepID=A0AA86PGQ5_9EUKA|nr:Putative RNA methylase [Hexamita inflata]